MMRSLLLTLAASAALTTPALAHFRLNAPASSTVQAANGDPQKTGPCGGGTPTTDVTNYTPGQTITLTLKETVNHPGHYRVALAQDEASLPAPPPVTADGVSACGSVPIQATPAMPILADGLLPNLTVADPEASVQVQLPAGMTCENCVLQVIQFMSDHDAPCFYYHCAKVNISASAPDGPPPATGDDAGTTGPGTGGPSTSGGCSTNGTLGGAAGALVIGLALVGLARRRRR